jgi:hypothetical protein
MVKTLRWWLTMCVLGVLVYFSYANGWLLPLYEKDATMITYLITVIFGATTLSLGYKSFLKKQFENEVEWFVSDAVLTLGMIGTIIGFMIMLIGTFDTVEFTAVENIRAVLSSMSKGLYTALSTTLIGLISSVILKIQLVTYNATNS